MKTIKLSFAGLLLMSTALAFTSCQKEEIEPEAPTTQNNGNNGNGGGGNPQSDSFYARLDGTEFVENILEAQELFVDEITITAKQGLFGGPAIQVVVPIDITPDVYSFNEFVAPQGFYTSSLGSQNIWSTEDNTGLLIIETNDTINRKLEGTFEFVATPINNNPNTNTHNISHGYFYVTY